jgi:thiamine monophosphate synthase
MIPSTTSHSASASSRRDDDDVDASHAIERHRAIESHRSMRWNGKSPPYLAIITETDACSSTTRVDETIRAIELATADGMVDLVVLRVVEEDDGPGYGNEYAIRKWDLLTRLATLKERIDDGGGRREDRKGGKFALVVNDDVDIVLEALSRNVGVDGVHVKERNALSIPTIRDGLERAIASSSRLSSSSVVKGGDAIIVERRIVVGTSCHSIESGIGSYGLHPRGPDYLFVGTCYPTDSHPEKSTADQLEGPTLPGNVRRELHDIYHNTNRDFTVNDDVDDDDHHLTTSSRIATTRIFPPIVFAIGGIDETNCREPVIRYGADGIAVIRTVMQAPDPGEVVQHMKRTMKE